MNLYVIEVDCRGLKGYRKYQKLSRSCLYFLGKIGNRGIHFNGSGFQVFLHPVDLAEGEDGFGSNFRLGIGIGG